MASEPDAIIRELRSTVGDYVRVGLEAGPLSQWLCFGLKDAGLPVVCIEARHAKAAMVAMNRNKNDRNDARSLAHLVRSGWFKAVHVKSRPSQELRTLLTAREFYVNKLRDHENEIRGAGPRTGCRQLTPRTVHPHTVGRTDGDEDGSRRSASSPVAPDRE